MMLGYINQKKSIFVSQPRNAKLDHQKWSLTNVWYLPPGEMIVLLATTSTGFWYLASR